MFFFFWWFAVLSILHQGPAVSIVHFAEKASFEVDRISNNHQELNKEYVS